MRFSLGTAGLLAMCAVTEAAVLPYEDYAVYARRSEHYAKPEVAHKAPKVAPKVAMEQVPAWAVQEFENNQRLSARSVSGSYDHGLQQQESWYWGNLHNPNANLTAVAKDKHERLLSMERFADSISKTTCSANSVAFTFTSKSDFTTAQQEWAWINAHKLNHVVLVTEEDSCLASSGPQPSGSDNRQTHSVQSATFNEKTMTATFFGQPLSWEDALGKGWHLHVNSQGILSHEQVSQHNATELVRRLSISKTFSLSVAHDFSGTIFSKTYGDVQASLQCANCGTQGSLNFDLSANAGLLSGISGSLGITPSGLGATVGLGLQVSGALTQAVSESASLFDAELPGGFSISTFVEVGLNLAVDAQASLSQVSAQATISYGVDITIPDSSSYTVTVGSGAGTKQNGWNPSFAPNGPDVSGSVSVSGSAGPSIALQLSATAFGTGLVAGIALDAPEFTMSLSAGASNTGVCGGSKGGADIDFDVGVGGALVGFGGLEDKDNAEPNAFTIYSTSTALFSTCVAVTGPNSLNTASSTSGGSTTSTASTTALGSAPPPTSTPASPSGTPSSPGTPSGSPSSTPAPGSSPGASSSPTPASSPASNSPSAPASSPASNSPSAPASSPASNSPSAPASSPASNSPSAPASSPASNSPSAPASSPASNSPSAPASSPASNSPSAPASSPASNSPSAPASTPAPWNSPSAPAPSGSPSQPAPSPSAPASSPSAPAPSPSAPAPSPSAPAPSPSAPASSPSAPAPSPSAPAPSPSAPAWTGTTTYTLNGAPVTALIGTATVLLEDSGSTVTVGFAQETYFAGMDLTVNAAGSVQVVPTQAPASAPAQSPASSPAAPSPTPAPSASAAASGAAR